MKARLECIPCILKQAYNTAKRATDDPVLIRKILDLTSEYLKTVELDAAPADISNFAYSITKKVTGIKDPYKKDKKLFNNLCLEKAPGLRRTIENSDNPLKTAVRLAILGNVIDMGIGFTFDLEKELKKVLHKRFAIDDFDELTAQLNTGRKRILYIGDNAGEIVFDSLLVERLVRNSELIFVVKKGPVINDAILEDAKYIGLTDMVKVIDTGSDGIGVKWSSVSEEFVRYYEEADIVLSKGQGNFETLSEKEKNIFFLLKIKCESVARELGVSFGDIVFKKGPVR